MPTQDGEIRILPIRTTDTARLCEWAKVYSIYGPYRQDPNIRYYIGFYQIAQGMQWKSTDSEYESWVSSAIHLIGAAEMLTSRYSVANHLPADLRDVRHNRFDTWEKLLLFTSRGMQNVHYGVSCAGNVKRKSRFSASSLVRDVAQAAGILFGMIPEDKCAQAVLDGTKIMTGEL